jgi:hypothetical protein
MSTTYRRRRLSEPEREQRRNAERERVKEAHAAGMHQEQRLGGSRGAPRRSAPQRPWQGREV